MNETDDESDGEENRKLAARKTPNNLKDPPVATNNTALNPKSSPAASLCSMKVPRLATGTGIDIMDDEGFADLPAATGRHSDQPKKEKVRDRNNRMSNFNLRAAKGVESDLDEDMDAAKLEAPCPDFIAPEFGPFPLRSQFASSMLAFPLIIFPIVWRIT